MRQFNLPEMNRCQTAALALITSDAQFICDFLLAHERKNSLEGNYVTMLYPFLGVFTCGCDKWLNDMRLPVPGVPEEYQVRLAVIRNAIKLYENPYDLVRRELAELLRLADVNLSTACKPLARWIRLYSNMGTDLMGDIFCGNTILCSYYSGYVFEKNDEYHGKLAYGIGKIAGEYAGHILGYPVARHQINNSVSVRTRDYLLYTRSLMHIKSELGLVLFCILCSINYITRFIDTYIADEVPQKLKLAYLQYYYLCDLIHEINEREGMAFELDNCYKNRALRNCLAHYGMQQVMRPEDIVDDDLLKGLTIKTLGLEYPEAKARIYLLLNVLVEQIQEYCGN